MEKIICFYFSFSKTYMASISHLRSDIKRYLISLFFNSYFRAGIFLLALQGPLQPASILLLNTAKSNQWRFSQKLNKGKQWYKHIILQSNTCRITLSIPMCFLKDSRISSVQDPSWNLGKAINGVGWRDQWMLGLGDKCRSVGEAKEWDALPNRRAGESH